MSCDPLKSTVLDAIIENGEVKTSEGIVIPDALHPYTNKGSGTGLVILSNDDKVQFVQNNLNTNLLALFQIFIDNLNFTAVSTDPLALEIQTKLMAIKTAISKKIKLVP